MGKGTAPAWQVRDVAREKVLEQIKQAIVGMEDEFENRLDLYRLVLRLVDMKLSSGTLHTDPLYTFSGIPLQARYSVFKILTAADASIVDFQRAQEEGLALWARIFKWATAQIVNSHLSALQALEMSNPQLIFGTESAMTEVPIE